MEEEIDLRPYLRALARRWWLVLGVALLAALAGLVYSASRPPIYQASAVLLTSQLDPAAAKTYPTYAVSNPVLQAVVDAYKPPAEARIPDWSSATLATMVTAGAGRDPSLLSLDVRTRSPQVSAAIAHQWADILITQGNQKFNTAAQDLKTVQDQAAAAGQALAAANAALAEYQGRNQVPILSAQLDGQRAAQKDLFSTQYAISNTITAALGLRDQLAQQPAGQPVSAADALAVLFLEGRTYNASGAPSVQVSLGSSQPAASRDEQVATLDKLMATLKGRSADAAAQLAALQPQLLASQRKLQEAQTGLDDVTRRQ
ncbi:MAG TPA: Wzz/FepE/Etk N-terminal domain-containing protein, partial [Anaerolineae bacterium]